MENCTISNVTGRQVKNPMPFNSAAQQKSLRCHTKEAAKLEWEAAHLLRMLRW